MPRKQAAAVDRPEPFERLFAAVVKKVGRPVMSTFVTPFAENGDLGVLRLMLDTGLVDCDKDDMTLLTCVIPVIEAVPPAEKQKAIEFVAEWRRAFEPVDPAQLDIALATASAASAKNLLTAGANPNGYANKERTTTALDRTYGTRNFESAQLMLKALAASGEIPMQAYNVVPDSDNILGGRLAPASGTKAEDISYFYGLLGWVSKSTNTGAFLRQEDLREHIRKIFTEIEVPLAWKKDLARSFLRMTEKNECRLDGGRVELFGDLLLHAEFDTSRDLLKAINLFADELRKDDCVDLVAALAKKLVDMGSHPDRVLVSRDIHRGAPKTSTWLQAAAYNNHRDMVIKLLELGADPEMPSDRGAGPNAYELAQEGGGEVTPVLDAWRARSAVESVLRKNGLGSSSQKGAERKGQTPGAEGRVSCGPA